MLGNIIRDDKFETDEPTDYKHRMHWVNCLRCIEEEHIKNRFEILDL